MSKLKEEVKDESDLEDCEVEQASSEARVAQQDLRGQLDIIKGWKPHVDISSKSKDVTRVINKYNTALDAPVKCHSDMSRIKRDLADKQKREARHDRHVVDRTRDKIAASWK